MRILSLKAFDGLIRQAGSIRGLARECGLDYSYLAEIASGKAMPGFAVFCRIADAMGVESLDDLVCDSEAEPVGDVKSSSLRTALRGLKISLGALAKRAGIPKSSLSEHLALRRRLRPDQTAALNRVLGELGIKVTILRASRAGSAWAEREHARRKRMETQMREPLRREVREAFGLAREPFATVDFSHDALLRTRDYQAAFEHLVEALEAKEFTILAGPVGVGKSHTLAAALQELGRRERYIFCRVAATDTERISTATLIAAILDDHSQPVPSRVEARARLLVQTLRADENNGKTAVVVVDEAHRLGIGIIKELKRFHEIIGRHWTPVLAIVLCGQPPLYQAMRRNPDLREVTWRASCIRLEGLKGEAREYLKHKLQRAGGSIQTWDQAATDALEAHCTIVTDDHPKQEAVPPLLVNVVAARAMDLAYRVAPTRGGRLAVKAEDVERAAEEVL